MNNNLEAYRNELRLHPFGHLDCEREVKLIGIEKYQEIFLENDFCRQSTDRHVYLIIGRRGSGKTAISNYLGFQKEFPNPYVIDVDEPNVFLEVISDYKGIFELPRDAAIPKLAKIWRFVIWSLVFRELRNESPIIAAASHLVDRQGGITEWIRQLLKSLLRKATDNDVTEHLEEILQEEVYSKAVDTVRDVTKKKPIFVSFDTLENYDIHNTQLMWTTAGLILAARDFVTEHLYDNVFVKVFLMAEVFPHLKEEVIPNVAKHVTDEIFLHWKPREIVKMISRRFWYSLKEMDYPDVPDDINWDIFDDVRKKIWDRYFGVSVVNASGKVENTIPYILRHSQLRPRQVIELCNRIAQCSRNAGTFPYFTEHDLIKGVKIAEEKLCDEIYNAYSLIYPHAGRIAESLNEITIRFVGSELDKRAHRRKDFWEANTYSQETFIGMMCELGIVGLEKEYDVKSNTAVADFEYFMTRGLTITPTSSCVIHPMFFNRLAVSGTDRPIIHPFQRDHPDSEILR